MTTDSPAGFTQIQNLGRKTLIQLPCVNHNLTWRSSPHARALCVRPPRLPAHSSPLPPLPRPAPPAPTRLFAAAFSAGRARETRLTLFPSPPAAPLPRPADAAKLSEEAERYDDMVANVKSLGAWRARPARQIPRAATCPSRPRARPPPPRPPRASQPSWTRS